MTAIRVLVADDQEIVRTGLSMILGAQPGIEVVAEAPDGRQAVELARRLRPDVCLLDIRMPGLDGIAATRELAGPQVADPQAVVIITTFDLVSTSMELSGPGRGASCSRTRDRRCSPRRCTPRRTGTR